MFLRVVWLCLFLFPIYSFAQNEAQERGYRVQQYDLKFHVQYEDRLLEGDAKLSVKRESADVRELVFDAEGLEIEEVRIGQDRIRFRVDESTVSVHVPKRISETSLKVRFLYSAGPSEGLYFTGPGMDDPRAPRAVYAMGEPGGGRMWFPCDEHPSRTAKVKITIVAPEDFIALANGELLDNPRMNKRRRTRTFRYEIAEKIPPPFVTITVGEFEVHRMAENGIQYTMLYPHHYRKQARDFLSNSPKALEFFEYLYGMKFRFNQYGVAIVTDFPADALEATQATQVDASVIRERRKIVGVHELSHHYDPMPETWNDLWIIEGKATYSEAKFEEWARRRDGKKTKAGIEHFKNTMEEFFTSYTEWERVDPRRMYEPGNTDPNRNFDAYAYEKAGWVYRMLEGMLGEETFLEGMRELHAGRAGKTMNTAEFQDIFERVSQRDLGWFFEQWVNGQGYPRLEWNWEWDAEKRVVRLHVRQYQSQKGFRLPLEFVFQGEDGRWKRETFTLNKRNQTFETLSITREPSVVLMDPGRQLMASHNYRNWTRERLAGLLMQNRDWLARQEALVELRGGNTPAKVNQELEWIREIISDRRAFEGLRASAVEALSFYRLGLVVDDLIKAVGSNKASIREGALFALMRKPTPKAFDAIWSVFQQHPSANGAWVLAASDPRRAEPILQEWVVDHGRSIWDRADALYGLGPVKSESAHATLGRYLDSDSNILRATAVDAMMDAKIPGFEKKLRALADPAKEEIVWIRTNAIEALVRTGDFASLHAIGKAATKDPVYSNRAYARDALRRLIQRFERASSTTTRRHPGFKKKALDLMERGTEADLLPRVQPRNGNHANGDVRLYEGTTALLNPTAWRRMIQSGVVPENRSSSNTREDVAAKAKQVGRQAAAQISHSSWQFPSALLLSTLAVDLIVHGGEKPLDTTLNEFFEGVATSEFLVKWGLFEGSGIALSASGMDRRLAFRLAEAFKMEMNQAALTSWMETVRPNLKLAGVFLAVHLMENTHAGITAGFWKDPTISIEQKILRCTQIILTQNLLRTAAHLSVFMATPLLARGGMQALGFTTGPVAGFFILVTTLAASSLVDRLFDEVSADHDRLLQSAYLRDLWDQMDESEAASRLGWLSSMPTNRLFLATTGMASFSVPVVLETEQAVREFWARLVGERTADPEGLALFRIREALRLFEVQRQHILLPLLRDIESEERRMKRQVGGIHWKTTGSPGFSVLLKKIERSGQGQKRFLPDGSRNEGVLSTWNASEDCSPSASCHEANREEWVAQEAIRRWRKTFAIFDEPSSVQDEEALVQAIVRKEIEHTIDALQLHADTWRTKLSEKMEGTQSQLLSQIEAEKNILLGLSRVVALEGPLQEILQERLANLDTQKKGYAQIVKAEFPAGE